MKSGAQPQTYKGVMVSSTYTDLAHHRQAVIKAITAHHLMPVVMESDSARPEVDVIGSSLEKVRESSAYIGIISHKYGEIITGDPRNPSQLSLTELEFNEALALERPILLFVMGPDHSVKLADVERDPIKIQKLESFRARAKVLKAPSTATRIYKSFSSLAELESAAMQSVAELAELLHKGARNPAPVADDENNVDFIPKAPALYADPPYIGSHSFVGRQNQLELLDEWAGPAQANPLLLFEAIGGTGKSMLTWEWVTKRAPIAHNWAGIFWYSFYEQGATMTDFCRRALAYMSGKPRYKFKDSNTSELTRPLVAQLRARPWLLVLDGLERVLVAYHRFDAAQVPDERAGYDDNIAQRDPCSSINPEDDDLLRALAGPSQSKILLTTRLTPRVLLNKSHQAIPGVLRERLPGLRDADAEALFRLCGINGSSDRIQKYLRSNCDCHPLVIGILAGLINDYLPDKGNFDSWEADVNWGGHLNLANLDLVQKRNHILKVALDTLAPSSMKLLSTLALLSESVDYSILEALNPHLPPIPEETPEPERPEESATWQTASAIEKRKLKRAYDAQKGQRADYLSSLRSRKEGVTETAHALANTIKDLESRGLLQYDHNSRRYDLHPVVRGVAAGHMRPEERTSLGQLVVDHFSSRAHNPYDDASSLDDFNDARRIVRALFHMGKLNTARDFIAASGFMKSMAIYFEAHNEILSVVRPFFTEGWGKIPKVLQFKSGRRLVRNASVALRRIGALSESFSVSEAELQLNLSRPKSIVSAALLRDLASTAGDQHRFALEDRLLGWALRLSKIESSREERFSTSIARFRQLSRLGRFTDAAEVWKSIDLASLAPHELAIAMHHYALCKLFEGKLAESTLRQAEELAKGSKSALGMRNLCALEGYWHLERSAWSVAKAKLTRAIELAHSTGKVDRRSEVRLAIAKFHLGELVDGREMIERFSESGYGSLGNDLATLSSLLGDHSAAEMHLGRGFRWSNADGDPYIHWHELNRSKKIAKCLGISIPTLRRYDPDSGTPLSWEKQVLSIVTERETLAAQRGLGTEP